MNEPNTLEQFVSEIKMDEEKALWLLRDACKISDLCESLHDVADYDCVGAIKYLDSIT